MVDPKSLQVKRELKMREDLAARNDVKKAVARLNQLWSGRGFGPRRDLLSHALRLSRDMSPEIADSVAACKETIGLDRKVEVYVRPDPMFNACCIKNETGPVMVVLSSRLLEAFTPEELRFVIGHELGHAAFDHFGIPMPATAMLEEFGVPFVPRPVALQLYAWCRAAEISADRIGLVCAKDADAAASGFFKLASGMSSPRVKPNLKAYAEQVEALASAPLAREKGWEDEQEDRLDCFSTHPYSPVRVRAVYAFSQSKAFRNATGQSGGGLSDEELESIIWRDLALMEPGYLEEKSPESEILRRLLYSAGVVIAAANGVIEASELAALASLLGADIAETSPQAVETARKDLPGRMEEAVKKVSAVKRTQLLQHLTIIAGADGTVDDFELEALRRIAEALQVDFGVVGQTMTAAAAPMD